MNITTITHTIKVIVAAVFVGTLTYTGVGCPGQATKTVSPSASVDGPSPVKPSDTEWCSTGCKYLKMLPGRDGTMGCEESRVLELPNGDILTCEEWCTREQKAGRNLYPSCWPKAKKCSDIEDFRKKSQSCAKK